MSSFHSLNGFSLELDIGVVLERGPNQKPSIQGDEPGHYRVHWFQGSPP